MQENYNTVEVCVALGMVDIIGMVDIRDFNNDSECKQAPNVPTSSALVNWAAQRSQFSPSSSFLNGYSLLIFGQQADDPVFHLP